MIFTRPAGCLAVSVALLLFPGVVASQAQEAGEAAAVLPPGPLTIDHAVAIALERNYDVAVAAGNLLAAQGRVWQSYRGFLPDVGASYSFNHQSGYSGTGTVDETGQLRLGDYSSDNQQLGIGLNQPIFSWANIQNVKGARAGERASQGLSASQKLDVALAVRIQFYELLKAIRLAEVRDEGVSLSEDQQRRAETLFELGSVARNDVLQARVNLQQARLEQIASRNRVELERGRLNQLLSLPVNTPLEISREIDTGPRSEIDSTAVVAEALAARPDLAAAREGVKGAEATLGAAKASHYPELFGSLNWGKTYNPGVTTVAGVEIDNDSDGWSARAGVSLNIFDGLVAEGQVKSAKGNLASERARLQQAELGATLEIKEAILGVREAKQSITVATDGVALAEENLKLAQERYQVGSGTILEFDEAQVSLIEARSSLVDAWAALFEAEARLNRARGAGLPETASTAP